MSQRAAAVRNAADPRQVRFGERLERRREERFTGALAAVLATAEGRIVLATLVRRAGVYKSVFDPHGGVQSTNIGRQDYGHELMADIIRTSLAAWQQLERDEQEWNERLEREIEAQSIARREAQE